MATKDFKELIKSQQETTKALMSSEDAAKYDTILTERQFEFDKKSESAKQGAETKRVNAAAAAEAKEKDAKATAAKEVKDAAKAQGKIDKKKSDVANAAAVKIAEQLKLTKNLTATSLGISIKSLEERKGRTEELKGQSKQLEKLKEGIEASGGKAEHNLKFNRLTYELEKKKLALDYKNATSRTAKKEIRNEQRALAEKQEGLLGSIARGMNFLRKTAKDKLASAGKGVMNLLKGTHGNQQYLSLDQLIGTIHNTTYKCKEDLPYLDQKSYIETKSTWTEEQKSVWLLNQKEKRKMKAYLSLLDQNPLTTEAYIPVKQETRIPFRLQTQEEKEYD